MDAQALLTPDAIEREMGRPLAHVPDPAGDCHARYARHFAGIFIDTFAGLGIHPDRYYWMSDIYPTGRDGSVHPDGARPGGTSSATSTAASPTSSTRTRWHPISVICPNCGKVGTTIVTDWDGEQVFFECRPDLVEWAHRLRLDRAGSRRSAGRPSCPGTSSGPPSGRCSA